MLAIRFARVGRKKQPVYRVVVSEKSKDMYGNHLEILGTYNPRTKETILKNDRIEHWLKNGAKASETVQNLFINEGIVKEDKKSKAVRITKKRQEKLTAKEADKKAAEAPKEEAPAEGDADTAAAEEKEAPAEEKKAEAPKEEAAEESK